MKNCKVSKSGDLCRFIQPICSEQECKKCSHADVSIVVIAAILTCETTAIQCDYCGQILTKPKTDC
jgi:ribosomal protein S27E